MIKRAEYVLFMWSVLSLVVSCQRDTPGTEVSYSGEGFRLMIPAAVHVQKAELADYLRYTFTWEGKGILDAYVGNQPNFLFDDQAVGPENITRLNGLPCKRVQAQKADGSIRTEVLIRFPRSYGWPAYIHFWYPNLGAEGQAIAEAIIASIQPQTEGVQLSPFPDSGGPDFPPTPLNSRKTVAEAEREQVSPEEKERRLREDERALEEHTEYVIAGMEQDLEKMKKEQGMTEEVKQWEAQIAQAKEELRLLKEEHRKAREER